jgi:hypothetical protein
MNFIYVGLILIVKNFIDPKAYRFDAVWFDRFLADNTSTTTDSSACSQGQVRTILSSMQTDQAEMRGSAPLCEMPAT